MKNLELVTMAAGAVLAVVGVIVAIDIANECRKQKAIAESLEEVRKHTQRDLLQDYKEQAPELAKDTF